MDEDLTASDMESAQQLVDDAAKDIRDIETDSGGWGDSSGRIEDAANTARTALEELSDILGSAIQSLADEIDKEEE